MKNPNALYKNFELVEKNVYIPNKNLRVVKDDLPNGVYEVGFDMRVGIFFKKKNLNSDNLIQLPDTVAEQIYKEAKMFWGGEMRKRFSDYGLLYKRGILLHGKPGTGKTCLINQICTELQSQDAVILMNPDCGSIPQAVEVIRSQNPERKVLVVFEEFDNMVNRKDFLNLLDGELQVDNIMYIATTNYIEHIPPRIKNRPSRFASVIELGVPSPKARHVYFESKLLPGDKKFIDELVEKTNGFVIDQLKDVIINKFCFNLSIEDSVKRASNLSTLEADTSSKACIAVASSNTKVGPKTQREFDRFDPVKALREMGDLDEDTPEAVAPEYDDGN